jgi:hypothetical protein
MLVFKLMKRLLLFVLILSNTALFAQRDTLIINGHKFLFRFQHSNDPDHDSISDVQLYRIEQGNSKRLLSHRLFISDGDCNSEALELGGYTVYDSLITFYSFWCKAGDAPVSPFGARKQVYKVAADGKVTLASSVLYIEEGYSNEGYGLLESTSLTAEEKELLNTYIARIEKDYGGNFLHGKKADELVDETRTALSHEITRSTDHWKDIESYVNFGIQK